MDWAKILDKFSVFIAALIPGSFVLLVAALHHSELWRKLWAQGAASGPSLQEPVPPQAPVVQPEVPLWRSQNWRSLLAVYLGTAAPENVVLIDESQLSNDALWQEWWTLLSWQVMPKDDPQSKRQALLISIEANFGGAFLIILLSAPWTPVLRHWWVVLPSAFWVLINSWAAYYQYLKANNPQVLYFKQMEYLQMHVCKGEHSDEEAG
jgi:hypothetical protein